MSMKEDYQNYCERRAEFEKNPMSKYWTEQNTRYMEPFRMFGNVYYVGGGEIGEEYSFTT